MTVFAVVIPSSKLAHQTSHHFVFLKYFATAFFPQLTLVQEGHDDTIRPELVFTGK